MQIHFHSEAIDFELPEADKIQTWLKAIIKKEKSTLGELTYIFCDDEYLHKINVEYLQHDTYTDVITFQYAEDVVHGDIFISLQRIEENAATFGVTTLEELQRVMAHGLLHLLGYKDKEQADKELMTEKENASLELL